MRLFFTLISLCFCINLLGGDETWTWQRQHHPYRIHVIEKGSGSQHVLLIHGFGANTYTWRYIIDPLANAGYHVWAIDLLGFGASDKPIGIPYSLDLYLDQIRAFLEAKKISKVDFVGNSMGGGISLAYTLRDPDRVKSLTLIDSMGYPMRLPMLLELARWAPEMAKYFFSRSLTKSVIKYIVYDKDSVTDEQVDAYWLPLTQPGGKEALLTLLRTFDNQVLENMSRDIKKIQVPTLIIWGEDDPLIPVSHASRFKEEIPHAQLEIIPRCGHIPQEEIPDFVNKILINFLGHLPTTSELTLEEKVGQMLMVHFRGETANEEAEKLIRQAHVGGFIYYQWANGLTSVSQVSSLSAGLQQKSKIPLLISVDQEGGRVMRLKGDGFTAVPSNRELAQTQRPEAVEQAAFTIGKELMAVGINMNLAPDVDVNVNPLNPVIGDRSYSDSADVVAALGKQALMGYHRAGVITTLKHFPGYGDVAVDPHADLPSVNKSLADLERVELLPFVRLADQTDAIMTAHLLIPALDRAKCATVSKVTLQGVLRQKIGFKGVIVSDSLVMQGLLNNVGTIDEAAIQAIDAGCDLLILGGKALLDNVDTMELKPEDVLRIHGSVVEAVRQGRISEAQIDASVDRILNLKRDHRG